MKKVEDWDIKIKIDVATCKQSFDIVCSIHTRIQQIVLKVCKLLGFDRFDTKMEVYAAHYIPMKPTSTLSQNGVKNGDIIIANILSTKKVEMNKSLPVTTTSKRGMSLKRKQSKCYGLTLVCTCIQPKCINYGVQKLVPIGFGQFQFFNLISSRKCNVCPYRDQKKNPSMVTKEIKVSNCIWKINGVHNSNSFPAHVDTGFKKVTGQSSINKTLDKYKWNNDICLIVKDL